MWVQKSSELSGKVNSMKHLLTDLSNKETDEQSIQWKLDTLKVSDNSCLVCLTHSRLSDKETDNQSRESLVSVMLKHIHI